MFSKRFWLNRKRGNKMEKLNMDHYMCPHPSDSLLSNISASCHQLWWDQAGISQNSSSTHFSPCSSMSCSCFVIKPLYVVSSHSHVAAEGPGKCCWQYTGRGALEWRKQQASSSIGWKIRSLPCNSAAGADIIRPRSAITQVIPPTDCNR